MVHNFHLQNKIVSLRVCFPFQSVSQQTIYQSTIGQELFWVPWWTRQIKRGLRQRNRVGLVWFFFKLLENYLRQTSQEWPSEVVWNNSSENEGNTGRGQGRAVWLCVCGLGWRGGAQNELEKEAGAHCWVLRMERTWLGSIGWEGEARKQVTECFA